MWDAGALLGEHSLATVGVTNLLLALSLLQANLEGREQRQKDRVADTCSTTSPQTSEELLTVSRYRSWNLPCFATPRTCVVTLDPRKRQPVLQGSFARQSGLFGDYLMFQAMKRGCFVFFLNMDSEG